MHAIQTLRMGGYKLALGFTALVAAFTLSMAAQAHAASLTGQYQLNFNTWSSTAYYNLDYSYQCGFKYMVGNFGTAYATVKLTGTRINYPCQIWATLYSTTGQWLDDAVIYATVTDGGNPGWAYSEDIVLNNGSGSFGRLIVEAYYPNPYGGYGCSGVLDYNRYGLYNYAYRTSMTKYGYGICQ